MLMRLLKSVNLSKINPKKVKVAFGCIARMYREAKNIKQEELADKIGLSRALMVNIEQGKQNVSLTQAINICQTLGIKPSMLFSNLTELCK